MSRGSDSIGRKDRPLWGQPWLTLVNTAALAAVMAAFVRAVPEEPVVWVWSGAVTTSSAVVKARIRSGASVRLQLARDPQFRTFELVPGRTVSTQRVRSVVSFELTGLEADTPYFYAVEAGGRRAAFGKFRTYRTGPMSFRMAFASCATTGSSHRIFDTIRRSEPLFFLHMGDFHYENIDRNIPELFREAFDEVLTSERQSALYREVPIAYVWDDHDFGDDDADGTSPSRGAALVAYQEMVPHYPLVRIGGAVPTIQQVFDVGRLRFIVTDLRAQRDPEALPDGPGKSMMGKAQLTWFFEQLRRAAEESAFVVWVSTVPWITKEDEAGSHGWAPWSYERGLIAERISQLGLVRRFLVLAGDGHMVAADDGTNSNYAATWPSDEKSFPVFHAAPLDRYPRLKGGPYSEGTSPRRVFLSWPKVKQYGLMEVIDDGQELKVILSGHDADGRVLRDMALRIHCRGGTCSVEE